MMKVLIADDEAPARLRIKMLLAELEKQIPNEVVGEAQNGQEVITQVEKLQPDCLLLDIQMPGMTGLEAAQHLQTLQRNQANFKSPALIFMTAFDDYAVQAFELHALDYVLKPVRQARLLDALKRVQNQIQQQHAALQNALNLLGQGNENLRQNFSVYERGRLVLVPVADVIYMRAELKYITLRTLQREFLIEDSLTKLEQEFEHLFIRIHRNALVARAQIAGVEKMLMSSEAEFSDQQWGVIMRGISERLPVSRRMWPQVKALVRP